MRTRTFLIGAAIAFVIGGSGASAASNVKEIHRNVPLAANGSVSLEMHNGSVDVTAWNQPSVDVSARIEPEPYSGRAEDVQATNVRISGDGTSVSIESDYSAIQEHWSFLTLGWNRSLPLIHYTIRVPATARVHVEEHNATAQVSGLRGDVSVRSHNGAVRVRDLAGAADIETHNGDIDVEFASFAKTSRLTTHNGDVEVAMPAASRLTLSANAHRRNPVSSDFPLLIRTSHPILAATINGGGPELRFTAHNGELMLRKR
jgi:hypothetical protein